VVCTLAAAIFGAFSVAAALGSLGGTRMEREIASGQSASAQARAQAAYDRVAGELATIMPGRSAGELEAAITAILTDRRLQNCEGSALAGPALRTKCIEVGELRAEAARDRRRAALTVELHTLRLELDWSKRPAHEQQGKVANADAVILAAYLQAIGIGASADRLNLILVLIAVLILECGAGLCFALGRVSSGVPGLHRDAALNVQTSDVPAITPRTPIAPATKPERPAAITAPTKLDTRDTSSIAKAGTRVEAALLKALRDRGGRAPASVRQLGTMVKRPKSTVHVALMSLLAAGVIERAGADIVLTQ
jgi:predicted transcriptional regulator